MSRRCRSLAYDSRRGRCILAFAFCLIGAHAAAAKALAPLPQPHAATDRVKQALTHLSGALRSAKCVSCHGAEGQSRADVVWRLALLGKAALIKFRGEPVGPKDFGLYYTLSGEGPVQMPPIDPNTILPTNARLLDKLSVNRPSPLLNAELKGAGADLLSYQRALGTQLIYVNAKGVCFDREATGAALVVGDLCSAFAELANVASTWKGSLAHSIKAWQVLTGIAKTSDLFATKALPAERIALPLAPAPASDGRALAAAPPRPVLSETVVYRLPEDETISFFTRVAPDESWVGLRADGIGRHRPDTRPFLVNAQGERRRLAGSSYDATFVPDFDDKLGHGFILAQRSAGSNQSFAKVLNLYLPGGGESPRRHWEFADISGYPSMAKIVDPEAVNSAWTRFRDQYIIMGKRWRWLAVAASSEPSGRTRDVTQVYPRHNHTAEPICPNLWRGDSRVSLLNADAMLSPDGRWISTGRAADHALLIIGTKSCDIEHIVMRRGTPVPAGKATFDNDGEFLAFHAYGSDGSTVMGNAVADNSLIARLANSGTVANIFVYELATQHLVQITHYDATNPYVALYPMFSGDGDTLYFHRHGRGSRSSEVVKIQHMHQVFEDLDAAQ